MIFRTLLKTTDGKHNKPINLILLKDIRKLGTLHIEFIYWDNSQDFWSFSKPSDRDKTYTSIVKTFKIV